MTTFDDLPRNDSSLKRCGIKQESLQSLKDSMKGFETRGIRPVCIGFSGLAFSDSSHGNWDHPSMAAVVGHLKDHRRLAPKDEILFVGKRLVTMQPSAFEGAEGTCFIGRLVVKREPFDLRATQRNVNPSQESPGTQQANGLTGGKQGKAKSKKGGRKGGAVSTIMLPSVPYSSCFPNALMRNAVRAYMTEVYNRGGNATPRLELCASARPPCQRPQVRLA